MGYVYAGGQLLARQTTGEYGSLVWKHTTPAGTGQYETYANSSAYNRIELDPMGADVGLEAPNPPDTGGGEGDIGANHFGGITDSRWSNFFDLSACCTVAGVAASCGSVTPNGYMEAQTRAFFGDRWYDLPGNNNEIERAEAAYARGVFITITAYRLLHSKPKGTTDPAEIAAYQAAMADLLNRILSRPECADLYGGVEQALGTLAGTKVSVENYGNPYVGRDLAIHARPGAETVHNEIWLNRQGSFFNSTLQLDNNFTSLAYPTTISVDTMGLQRAEYAALVLAHELGHRVGIYGKNDIDGADNAAGKAANKANTQNVFDACFK